MCCGTPRRPSLHRQHVHTARGRQQEGSDRWLSDGLAAPGALAVIGVTVVDEVLGERLVCVEHDQLVVPTKGTLPPDHAVRAGRCVLEGAACREGRSITGARTTVAVATVDRVTGGSHAAGLSDAYVFPKATRARKMVQLFVSAVCKYRSDLLACGLK